MTRKSAPTSARGPGDPQQSLSPAGCLIQFVSGFGGFAVLVLIWVTIMREPAWNFTFKDILYWGTAIGMIAAQQVGYVRSGARDPDGEITTARDVRRSTLMLLIAVGLLWCLGQAIHV